VIGEINRIDGTDYQVSDVYFNLDREVMTNASDNATIEKTDAEKQQIQINTILSLQGVIDDDTIIQTICEILDIDYEDIKDKLPKDEGQDVQEAQNDLEQVIPEDEGGDPLNE
jgi:hypothetical protein